MIRFNLHKRNDTKSKKFAIKVILTYNKKRFTFDSGIKIESEFWDIEKQKVKKNCKNHITYNSFLQSIEIQITDYIFNSKRLQKKISIPELKRYVNEIIKPDSKNDNFLNLIDRVFNSKNIKQQSKVTYKTFKSLFDSFCSDSGIIPDINNLNQITVNQFVNYMIKKEYTATYINLMISIFKSTINVITDSFGYDLDLNFKNLKNLKTKKEFVILNKTDIQKIFALESENLKLYKDMFLVQIFTGLRFSDLVLLKKTQIQKDFIVLSTQKTDSTIMIPIPELIKPIINEYSDKTNKYLFDSKLLLKLYNRKIQLVCKYSDITELISISNYIGINRNYVTKPKYELITSHTARRTFINLALESGINTKYVKMITGHKNDTSFDKYVNLNRENLTSEITKLCKGLA